MVSENVISALREQIKYLIINYPEKRNNFHFIVRMIYNSYANNMSATCSRHIKAFLSNEAIPDLNLLLNLYLEAKHVVVLHENNSPPIMLPENN